jgi:hypothetical protein
MPSIFKDPTSIRRLHGIHYPVFDSVSPDSRTLIYYTVSPSNQTVLANFDTPLGYQTR